jgi:hypothetical protein
MNIELKLTIKIMFYNVKFNKLRAQNLGVRSNLDVNYHKC